MLEAFPPLAEEFAFLAAPQRESLVESGRPVGRLGRRLAHEGGLDRVRLGAVELGTLHHQERG